MTWVIRNGSPTYVRDEDVKSSDKKFGESVNRVTAEIVTEKPKLTKKKKTKKTSE